MRECRCEKEGVRECRCEEEGGSEKARGSCPMQLPSRLKSVRCTVCVLFPQRLLLHVGGVRGKGVRDEGVRE